MMKLFGYWRSTAAYRVRIALHLKGIDFESVPVHLIKNGGEQHANQYSELNPSHLVPTLVDGQLVLNQSMAIIDYIDTKYSEVPLYPQNIEGKAHVQALSLDIACEIHPLNNLRVQQYLTKELDANEDIKLAWTHHWMKIGFSAFEARLLQTAGEFCYGDSVSVADICLVAQVYNANRFNLDMSPYPKIISIIERCNTLPAFIKALPENQEDAQ
jgi:maleylacetoacetate isomerase/maleylpyruvate isomerase